MVCGWHDETGAYQTMTYQAAVDYQIAKLQMDAEPAADVAPVVHSEWINHSGGNATCRRCGVRQRAVYDDDNDQNFCGHCGAKMDGGGHGD